MVPVMGAELHTTGPPDNRALFVAAVVRGGAFNEGRIRGAPGCTGALVGGPSPAGRLRAARGAAGTYVWSIDGQRTRTVAAAKAILHGRADGVPRPLNTSHGGMVGCAAA